MSSRLPKGQGMTESKANHLNEQDHWLPWCVVGLVIIAYWALEVWGFEEAFVFHGDHERDLRMVTGLVQRGEWPTVTPSVSPFPFQLGPLLYLLMAPMVAISADPFVVRLGFLLLIGGGAAVFFHVLRGWVRWEAAVIAIFGLLASTFSFEMSRQLWHSSLLPLPIAVFFWAAAGLLNPQKSATRRAVTASIAAAIALQLHVVSSVYCLLLLGLLWHRRRDLRWKGSAIACGAFILALTPMIWTFLNAVSEGMLAQQNVQMPSTWSPAGPITVLSFFVDNVHTVWGDNLGPMLTWPFVVLMATGGAQALRQRAPWMLFLVINVVLGWVIESLLLGNQQGHRYMHANLYAAFSLAALGAHGLFEIMRTQWLSIALGVVLIAVTVEASVSPVPHANIGKWLNAREQQAVAQIVATEFPLPDEAMEHRVHGMYFGELTGIGHFHSLYADTSRAAFSESAHVMIMPKGIDLVPHGTLIAPPQIVEGPHRSIAVYAYEPSIDSENISVEGPLGKGLFHKWRRLQKPGLDPQSNRSPTGAVLAPSADPQNRAQPSSDAVERDRGPIHTLTVPVKEPGILHLVLHDGRDERGYCEVIASIGANRMTVQPLDLDVSWVRFLPIHVEEAGELTLRVGPCREIAFFDLW